MRRCKVRDFYPLPSSREVLPGTGFLRAPAKIARTGIQVYSAKELGLDGGPQKLVKLYRPPEEVAKSAKTFESAPMTNEHPPRGVDASNWKLLAVGDVRDVSMAGEELSACVIVRDTDTIGLVQDGKAELSCGYEFNLDMTPGTTPDGQSYDGIQRDIEGNHVAIVDRGRAGARVRIGDRGYDEGAEMTKHRIKIGDRKFSDKIEIPGFDFTLELDDAVAKQVGDKFDLHAHGIGAAKDAYDAAMTKNKQLEAACDALKKQVAEAGDPDEDGDVDEMDDEESAEMESAETGDSEPKKAADGRRIGYTADGRPTLRHRLKLALDRERRWKKAATDQEALDKRAAERQEAIDAARPFVGDEFEPKGKTVHQIRLAAIDAAAKDEGLAPIVKAQLGGRKPEKLSADDAKRALDTLAALKGVRVEAADDGGDQELSKTLAGTGGGASRGGPAGRNIWLTRSAADSRKHNPTEVPGNGTRA